MKNNISQLSIIIPCRNNEKNLIKVLPYVIKFCNENILEFEILVILNGSKQQNTLELKEFLQSNKIENVLLISNEIVGKGAAIKKGVTQAKFENLLISDADFSVSIDHILKFLDKNNNFLGDFIVGSRKMKKSSILKTPLLRILSGFFYTLLVKSLLGIKVSDTQCGFKFINIKNFTKCIDFTNTGFSYDVELFFLAKQEKIPVIEVPVDYIHNKKSNVKIVSDSLTMVKDLFLIFWKYRLTKSE